MNRLAFCLVAVLAAAAPPRSAAATETPLTIVITSDGLKHADPGTRLVARDEVEAVWAPYGVLVLWENRAGESPARADLVIRIAITEEPVPGARPTALAAVFRVNTFFRRFIVVSQPAVRNLVRHTARVVPGSPAFDRLYARLLGRVIAHELGHILLSSTDHSASGLMRQEFDKKDVLYGARDGLRLEPEQVAMLRRPNLTASAEPTR